MIRTFVRSNAPVVAFVGMLWARVSDVGISDHGLPSLTVPFALVLVSVAMWRRLASSEHLGLNTFRHLWPILPYATVVVASVAWAAAPARAMQSALDLTKDLIIFWVLVELIADRRTLEQCCLAIALAAGALSAVSIYQEATGSYTTDYGGFAQASIRQIVGPLSLYRLSGPVGDPNYYALILTVALALALAMLRRPLHAVLRLLVLATVVLICGAVLLTYSRGGAVVLVIAIGLSLVHSSPRVATIAALGLVIPFGLLLTPASVWDRLGTLLNPLPDDSVELRIGAQQVALEMFLDHPFVGVGANSYPVLYEDYSRNMGVPAVASEFFPHNLYLQVAAETGTVGLLTFAPIVLVPLLSLEQLRREPEAREWREIVRGLEIALICYLVASLTLHASYPRYMWILLALSVAARVRAWRT